jgi:hypothetical protein
MWSNSPWRTPWVTPPERAYRRGTALEHRRELMKAWAAYCDRPPEADNIIPMERIKPIPA